MEARKPALERKHSNYIPDVDIEKYGQKNFELLPESYKRVEVLIKPVVFANAKRKLGSHLCVLNTQTKVPIVCDEKRKGGLHIVVSVIQNAVVVSDTESTEFDSMPNR